MMRDSAKNQKGVKALALDLGAWLCKPLGLV